jgi:hypothetical protein
MHNRGTAALRQGMTLLADKTNRATVVVALAFGLVWAPAAYACTHGQPFYVPCGANWSNWWQNVEVCKCDCVGGQLGTNCTPLQS